MNKNRIVSLRHVLLGATSLAAAGFASPALASDTVRSAADASVAPGAGAETVRPTSSEERPSIIIRDDLGVGTPLAGPADTVDITGVGQMTVRANPTTTSMGLCTGTLINPRTVIFAAHCVNGARPPLMASTARRSARIPPAAPRSRSGSRPTICPRCASG